jgi:multisubunit Na+/H+ antiporter MnhE subunit
MLFLSENLLYIILLIISALSLVGFYFVGRKNFVWGGAIIGIIVGAIAGVFAFLPFVDSSFLKIVGWGLIIGTLCGDVPEIIGLISAKLKRA